MSSELVSIVVPIYNVEQYLDECIQSLVNQTYKNIEIIAINDGSTDNSLKIIEGYKNIDNRISIISWNNRGQAACRNEGVRLAKGKYILFIDSDDYIDKNTVEVLIESIKKNDSEIVVYNGTAFDDFENEIKFHKNRYFNMPIKFNNKSFSSIEFSKYGINFIQPCMKIYNVDFIKSNNIIFPEGKYGEDVEFWYKCCALSESISYIDFNGYYRRYRINSVMTGGSIKNIADRIENFGALEKIVLSIDKKNRQIFTQNLGYYALGIYSGILRVNKNEIKSLYMLFKENNGMEIIKFAKLKPKSLLKKHLVTVGLNIKILV